MKILYKPHDENAQKPTRGSEGAAGWDIFAATTVKLFAYKPTLVPANMDIAIPEHHAMLILPRSGRALKTQTIIPNSPGLIDEDYRGHLQVILTWIPSPNEIGDEGQYIRVEKGDRIAQAVLVRYWTQEWEETNELPPTERGRRGFGSTDAGS